MKTQIHLASLEAAIQKYEILVRPARDRFVASRGLQGMISPDVDARTMVGFLIYFSALSSPF
jgi:hypothetical protein